MKLVEQSVAKKLQLPLTVTFTHLYQLSWFKQEHEVTIYVQWLISFTILAIFIIIMCDVIMPILGRPWQFVWQRGILQWVGKFIHHGIMSLSPN